LYHLSDLFIQQSVSHITHRFNLLLEFGICHHQLFIQHILKLIMLNAHFSDHHTVSFTPLPLFKHHALVSAFLL